MPNFFRQFYYVAYGSIVATMAIVIIDGITHQSCDTAKAAPVEITQRSNLTGEGVLAAGHLDALNNTPMGPGPRWTGWIAVNTQRSIAFDLDYTVGPTGTGTAVNMDRCEISIDDTILSDAGNEIQGGNLACAAGSCTFTTGTLNYTVAVSGDYDFVWVITDIPGPWINCRFSVTGGNPVAGDDLLDGYVRGITP